MARRGESTMARLPTHQAPTNTRGGGDGGAARGNNDGKVTRGGCDASISSAAAFPFGSYLLVGKS